MRGSAMSFPVLVHVYFFRQEARHGHSPNIGGQTNKIHNNVSEI